MPDVARRILALPAGRRLVALAGPPAAGKSTMAAELAHAVSALGRPAQVVPMDGFHLDNATLDRMGLRDRKGAPETFDIEGLTSLVRAVRGGGTHPFPVFDRTADAVIADGGTLTAEIAIFEGNYLLLDADGWRALHPLWDMTVALTPPEILLEARLIERWTSHGLPPEAARARAARNDLPNARLVLGGSIPADMVMGQPTGG
nr:hypothetical protein [Jannaschia sp. S6380]